jgi:hypothetical protein
VCRFSKRLFRQQALEFFGILDVELEAAGHHDVAGLLIGFAGSSGVDLTFATNLAASS